MLAGIFAGLTWALETLFLGLALGLPLFAQNLEAALLAPFVCAFLHDALSSLWLALGHFLTRRPQAWQTWQKQNWWIVLAAAIGGPIGMTGYVLAVKFMGPGIGVVACAIFPAVGAVLAYLILGEKLSLFRWLCLLATLVGVWGLSASSQGGDQLFLGLISAIMCAGGWGLEAVILAKCLKGGVKPSQALQIRQTAAAMASGLLLLVFLKAGPFLGQVFASWQGELWTQLALASILAKVSYLCYYRAIDQIGPSRVMALNVTYAAWAFVLTVLAGEWQLVNWQTLGLAGLVFTGSILTAADYHKLKRGDH